MEIWKEIIGYENYYKVSNYGNITSIDRLVKNSDKSYRKAKSTKLNPTNNGRGYLIVFLCKGDGRKNHYVHRLVATHFLDNPKKLGQVNHKDGDKTNNHFSNLEWCTSAENLKHARDVGLIQSAKGERQGKSKLKEYQVLEIRERVANNETYEQIAKDYPVQPREIGFIARREHWKHI